MTTADLRQTREYALGIDFSGARDAGRRIWIRYACPSSRGLEVERCIAGECLPGSGRLLQECLRALRVLLADSGKCIVGLDFPFGLPRAILARLPQGREYTTFLSWFRTRFESGAAQQFQNECKKLSAPKELKRQTDKHAEAPFSPYNLRLFRQTFYGMRDVLAPLVKGGGACVLPMTAAEPGKA
jgi:hypothetical protein